MESLGLVSLTSSIAGNLCEMIPRSAIGGGANGVVGAGVMVVCCVHLEINRDEVSGGQAKLFHDFEACQAALAACVGHGADEGPVLWRSEGESKVVVVLLLDAHLKSDVRLGLGLSP